VLLKNKKKNIHKKKKKHSAVLLFVPLVEHARYNWYLDANSSVDNELGTRVFKGKHTRKAAVGLACPTPSSGCTLGWDEGEELGWAEGWEDG
jgi:hypothetical protein